MKVIEQVAHRTECLHLLPRRVKVSDTENMTLLRLGFNRDVLRHFLHAGQIHTPVHRHLRGAFKNYRDRELSWKAHVGGGRRTRSSSFGQNVFRLGYSYHYLFRLSASEGYDGSTCTFFCLKIVATTNCTLFWSAYF